MTKTEFQSQFKRLRVAGYRLPVFDGITIADVIEEWYGTFGNCSVDEFSKAIDLLKQKKTDTFWPATGELWAQVYEIRKARRIRLQAEQPSDPDTLPQAKRDELAGMFRDFAKTLAQRMAMKSAPSDVQEVPDHVALEQEDQTSEGHR
jgi:hypothetical protein